MSGTTINPFRRYCKLKGIKGKAKKRLRKELAKRASARNALASRLSSGGLVNVQPQS